MSAIKLLSLLIIMTFLETANFIHVPTRTESVEHNGVLLALKYNKAANEYVSNLKDKPSSKSTSEAAWDFAQAAADYLNYTQNKDNLRKNDFLQNPNPLTNSKKLETVIEQTKIKGVAKPSNTVTIIVPAKNSESKSQYPSLNAIFNQNMAQYYLQKKHSKMAPVKADKEAKKVKAANKEKILLLKAKRPVSKAASFNKQAMMSTQREALKINNNLTPVLRLQMSNNHPQASQNHHQRVQTVHNPSTLSHQIKPLSANSPRMSSAPHFSQHQHHHQQKAHHQQQQQNPLQNSQRTLHSSQTHRPSSSQVAQTPVLSYSSAPYLAQTPQPLYYQPSRPVTNLWPNLFNVPHFNIGDILERSRPTKLKEKSETAEEKTKTLQAVTTQTGEDEEDEDEDEEDEDEIEENEDNNEEDEENVTDVDETATDEDEDDVEDDNEDTDDSFINQLSMQRPPLFAAAPRLANLYENEFEIPAPQNYQDFVPLRPSSQSHEDDIESARKRLHQIRQRIADLQKNNNPISVNSQNLVTGQLNRPFINQPGNENQRLVNVPKRLGSIHQLKLTKPITNEAEVEDEKEDEDKEQDSQEDKEEKVDDNENVDSEDENESKAEPEETSTNDQKENVDNEEELEKSDSQEDPKSSTSTDDSSKDEIESLNDELNKCLSEENDSSEISALDTCLDRIFSPEKETQESENEDKNKEFESNDDVDE